MLTNQLIGAGHNAVIHGARPTASEAVVPQLTPAAPGTTPAEEAITARPVQPADKANKAERAEEERTKLDHAEWLEKTLAVLDKIPDAVPESIYEAKAVREDV